MLIGAVLLGAVLLTGVLALAVVAAIVISVRVWWYKRKLRNQPPEHGGQAPSGDGRLIEAEYTVVRDPARIRGGEAANSPQSSNGDRGQRE
jgi:hypothetical protein